MTRISFCNDHQSQVDGAYSTYPPTDYGCVSCTYRVILHATATSSCNIFEDAHLTFKQPGFMTKRHHLFENTGFFSFGGTEYCEHNEVHIAHVARSKSILRGDIVVVSSTRSARHPSKSPSRIDVGENNHDSGLRQNFRQRTTTHSVYHRHGPFRTRPTLSY